MGTNQSKKWYEPILDWFKLNGVNYVISLLTKYGSTYIKSAIGGIPGTIATALFKWVVMPFLLKFRKDLIIDKEAKEKLQDFVNIIGKEGITHEEFSQAGDDFFNRP